MQVGLDADILEGGMQRRRVRDEVQRQRRNILEERSNKTKEGWREMWFFGGEDILAG